MKEVQLPSEFAKRRTNDREAGIIFCFSCLIRAHYPFESRFHSGIRCEFLRVETRLANSQNQSLTNSLKISRKWKPAFRTSFIAIKYFLLINQNFKRQQVHTRYCGICSEERRMVTGSSLHMPKCQHVNKANMSDLIKISVCKN